MLKTYQIKDAYSVKKAINFPVNGSSKLIVFESKNKNSILTFETSDADIQGAIETSKYFKTKESTMFLPKITVIKTENTNDDELDTTDDAGNDKQPTGAGTKEYPEVTTFEDAKTVLKGEPYNVAFQALGSPEKIFAKAAEMGVSFPNLKV